MENKLLQELNLTESKIRTALAENNFLQVSLLSTSYDEQVKKFTNELRGQTDVSEKDIALLKELNVKLIAMEKDTIEQFRKFSSETSTKTKMHNAYKNYGI